MTDLLAGTDRLPSKAEVLAAAGERLARIAHTMDAKSVEEVARDGQWPGGPSFEAIIEHETAVREIRARRARGEDVPDIPPLTLARAAELDAARAARPTESVAA